MSPLLTTLIVLAVLVAVAWALLHLKTSRPDGDLLRVHPYRRLMFYIMPTRTESQVYFDETVDARKLLAYLERARPALGANVTHCVVAAANMALAATPRMNRFVVGRRLYQRRGRWLTFSMKRGKTDQGIDRKAKLATVKLLMKDGETFREFCDRVNSDIRLQRSGKKTSADKEFQLFNALPRPLLEAAARLVRWLDHNNLLPGFFIEGDPMYTSIFIANLGSVQMGPGYHHLYEYGTCPLFIMAGQIEPLPRVIDGRVEVVPTMRVRFTFDERIDDGLNARFGIASFVRILEDPERWFGSLDEGGADAMPLWPREDWASEDGQFEARD